MENQPSSALEALKDRVRALGEDAAIFVQLPYRKAYIAETGYSSKESLERAVQKKLLSDRILLGTIAMSCLWAHLLDNSATNGNPELVYYSHNGKFIRYTATEAKNGGSLYDEFTHCDSPEMLTATATYYLYKRGVKTSFPVTVSNALAREVIKACKAFVGEYGDEEIAGDQAEDGSQLDVDMHDTPDERENKDVKLEDYTDSGFVTPQPSPCAKLSGSSSKRSSRTSSSNAHPHTPVHNSIDVNSSRPIARLRAIQENERNLTLDAQNMQALITRDQKKLVSMEDRRSSLHSDLAALERAMEAMQNDTILWKQREKDLLTAAQKCKNEQKEMMERMDPELCSAIEFGRQLERRSK